MNGDGIAPEGMNAAEPAGSRWSAMSPGLTRYIWLLWVIWLIFLWYPIISLLHSHPSPVHLALVLAGAAAFAAVYIWNIVTALDRLRIGTSARTPWLPLAAMVILALALTFGDRSDWIELFIFITVSMGPLLPPRRALIAVGVILLFTPLVGVLIGGSPIQVAQMMFQSAVSGIAVIIVVRTIVLDRELRLAREEIARLAVSEERLRFARDLHDLLGHSLSLIALKSELVGRLIPVAPERAAAENADVESVARRALQEVREAVAGYRQPGLADELRSAREILTAAGIEYRLEGTAGEVPAAQEAALSWVVREGVTNVIKHSRAHACTIRLERDPRSVSLAVLDDGRGNQSAGAGGSGLAGLCERIEALGGRCEAAALDGAGFRLAVRLPVAGSAARQPSPPEAEAGATRTV